MDNPIIAEYDSQVHDNIITGYSVDFVSGILILETRYEDKEVTKIVFKGLLAHKFENAICDNIIFELYQTDISHFVLNEKDLDYTLKYGFPSPNAKSSLELEALLKEGAYKVFYIGASLGLCGYIIAKEIEIMIS